MLALTRAADAGLSCDVHIYDLLVIGGGVNGSGIARDAAGNGLSVLLCDAGDIGGATSASSTKLIHGGLRYLEFYEFALVRKALAEREVILRIAPHISWPMSFVLPHVPQLRPAWMIRAGLFLYDHLAQRQRVPGSEGLNLRRVPAGQCLQPQYQKGFRYWDGWIEDNRLTVLNAMDAQQRGATILPRTAVLRASAENALWQCDLSNGNTVAARAIVNAAGPWADGVARTVLGQNDTPHLRLVKGSHIVVARVNSTNDAYFLQQPDGRIIFIIPYEQNYSLIGTTEESFTGDARAAKISAAETGYLLAAANRFLQKQLGEKDILWTYAGVRPLIEGEGDNRSASRDWHFDLHHRQGAPALTVLGGKITTYRVLAEAALEALMPHLGAEHRSWTAESLLPGGASPPPLPEWVPADMARRILICHGSLWPNVLAGAQSVQDLGGVAGGLISRLEVAYMVAKEWVQTPEDVLWRRTKLGLHLDSAAQAKVAGWLTEILPAAA
jgi:glycerol-3-phosphate dehydrogenase